MMNKKSKSRALVTGGIAASAAVTAGTVAAYARVVRPWSLRWGATGAEVRRALPGDELVPHPRYGYTRAITIHAPAEQVWQWIAQVGQNRGGLYTHERLESLFGKGVPNAERILPEFQNPQVGDYILLYPNGPGYAVESVVAPRYLVLHTINFDHGDFTTSVERDGMVGTWVFFLEPRPDKTTRLIVRSRLDYEPAGFYKTMWSLVEPVDFILNRKTLLGIKERAEAHRVPDELLDRVMPEYEFRGVESVRIRASAEQIFEALSDIRGAEMPLADALGELRYLPARLFGHAFGGSPRNKPFVELILKTGFIGLGEEPNREVVIGAIGKFHELFDQHFVRLNDADEFRRFLHADYQKLAISFRVTGDSPAVGLTLTLEHRTHAMSEHARKQFARYWRAIKPGGAFVSQQLLHAVKHRAEALARKAAIVKEEGFAKSVVFEEEVASASSRAEETYVESRQS